MGIKVNSFMYFCFLTKPIEGRDFDPVMDIKKNGSFKISQLSYGISSLMFLLLFFIMNNILIEIYAAFVVV